MDVTDLVKYSESLYKTAYLKMNNTADADELTQETLFQALIELRKNPDKIINNDKAWLNGIMNNCFYAMMRKKYKATYVTYDVVIDNYLYEDNINDFIDDDETRIVHKNIQLAVSRLAKIHRDVIYKFYMQNKSVNQIAEELNIPRGTVLSRLDNGRKIIKQGVMNMNKNLMYKPQNLSVAICGRLSYGNEPFSNITTSIHKNILILAYEKPITESEISAIMGIPCVYIEEIVNKLIDGELMKRTSSGKVYTDFVIEFEDKLFYKNENSLNIVNDKFELIWKEYESIFDNISNIDFVKDMTERQRNKLYVFSIIKAMQTAINKIRVDFNGKLFLNYNDYPERIATGKWYAIGTQSTEDNEKLHIQYKKYELSGMHSNECDYNGNRIGIIDFQTSLGDTHFGYLISDQFAKFLYDVTVNNISSENEKYMKDVPLLCKMGILENNDDIVKLDIPNINFKQLQNLFSVIDYNNIYTILKDSVIECYKKQHATLPAHLKDSIPSEFLTTNNNVLTTGFLVTAKEKGLFLNGTDYPCPAIVFYN